jgi:surface carbohydrate biosynthesis protein
MNNINISSRPWLLIPVETKAREFHAKVLFSCFAAERGWGTILGPRRVIRQQQTDFLPKGVLIEKSVSPVDLKHLQTSAENGNRMTGWDEEGLLYLSKADYMERRISKEALGTLEYFFCWGKKQHDDLTSEIDIASDRLVMTGNPRFDLLRKNLRGVFRNEKIQKKYGPYILINTKFGVVLPNDNYSEKYSSWLEWLKASGRCQTEEQEKRLLKFVELQEHTLDHYRKLIPELSRKFPNHQIVIRPHPSENNEFWMEETKDLKNVHVVYEGSVNEWILSADAMIHSNCTTGIEAYLLGQSSVSFLPFRSPEVECHLANDLSIQTFDVDETVHTVQRLVEEGPSAFDLKGCEEAAKAYIESIDGTFACEKILDVLGDIEGVEASSFAFPGQPSSIRRKIKGMIYKIKHPKEETTKPNKRFPGISYREVTDTIASLQEQSGLFEHVRAEDMGQDTFCIYRSDD